MRKQAHQQSSAHHELIINYRQEETSQIQALLPIWTKTWHKFQVDILSYILPAICKPATEMTEENMGSSQPTAANKQPRHSFSFAYSTRELKKILVLHAHLDVFVEVRNQITRIFYKIANAFVNYCFQTQADDISVVFVEVYQKIETKLGVLIGCLNLVLNKFITRKGIEEEIYSIINKELVNHHCYENYVNSCIESVESLRNYCLTIKQVCPDSGDPQQPSTTHPKIEKIRTLNKLKIFPYVQYVQRSKNYYAQLLPKIPNNIWMFPVVFNLIKCEKLLESTIVPYEEQLESVKKLLKTEGWRALQQETMIKVFCKEILDEIYDDMIQYIDYLIDFETEPPSEKEMGSRTNYSLNLKQKKDLLKYLWQITKLLEKNYVNQKQRYPGAKFTNVSSLDKKNVQHLGPMAKLLNRITIIISDIKKFINPTDTSKNSSHCLYKIIYFRDHILAIVSQCFDNDSKFLNAITIKIEEAIVQEEQAYNLKLCQIVLSPKYWFPGTVNDTCKVLQSEMQDQSQEQVEVNNKCSFQLFKLTPSKEQFIRKFEQEFSNYVLKSWDSRFDLTEQQNFIRPIQKESGYSLSKNIERMISDVWKNGEIVLYKTGKIVARVLCQDWPHPAQSKYKLADKLIEIRQQFEVEFLSQAQNDKKKLRWIQQLGRVHMNISGIQSSFSELQASIIILLSRSYRPIKSSQFKQMLEYTENDMEGILFQLASQNILIFNKDSKNYELNYDNSLPYTFESKQRQPVKSQKKKNERDYVAVIQACIARILKRRKAVQKTDLSKILSQELKVGLHQASMEQINTALQRLSVKEVVSFEKTGGIIKYLE